jgi:two-component system, cell cycle response regulator DivK
VRSARVLSLAVVSVHPVIAEPSDPMTSPLVLIVEDDIGTRVMYRDYLVDSGFRIVDAHNGHQALAKARERPPDAIVTDLAVPGMDGFEFCRRLKQSAGMQDIPIIAVTGHAEYLQQPDRFEQAGIAQVLVKPCPPDVIVRELRRLLKRNASPSSVAPR